MTDFNTAILKIREEAQAHLARATYFILEAKIELDDHDVLASIEDAEDGGGFAIHIGLPDRPDERYAFWFDQFNDGVTALAALRVSHPDAGLWLSTQELLAEIEGADLWRGVVEARASCDPTDPDCDWNKLAAAVITKAATGAPITVDPFAHPVIAGVAARL